MLEVLHIKNLALIDDMTLEFSEGMNVLTGETGAGKSFIIKALNFVTGDKLSADIVRPGAEKAQVEAVFSINDHELVLRRELAAANGRSRFYINDAISSQDALRELRPRLLSNASQHAQQQLMQPAFQAMLLDSNIPQNNLFIERNQLLAKLKELAKTIEGINSKQEKLLEKRELLEMQKAEIKKVSPKPGEEEELEELRSTAKAHKDAAVNYNRAMALLHGDDGPGILDLMLELERLLSQMAKSDTALENDLEETSAMRQQLSVLAQSLRKPAWRSEKINMDEIEERLFAFSQLKRKLKRTMPQILDLQEEIDNNLSFLDLCALDLARLTREQQQLATRLKELMEKLKPLREDSARTFANQLEMQLKDLGFSEQVKILPEFVKQEIWPGIEDERGRILWAPNPGQLPQALDKIASGGELSRFLLGLCVLNPQNENITYIFDEVDAGVGGLTLNKMGDKLAALAEKHQVILITHWPQLAARAKSHFQINKIIKDNQTYTKCVPIAGKEREAELARMAGGGKQGEALAKKLLQM